MLNSVVLHETLAESAVPELRHDRARRSPKARSCQTHLHVKREINKVFELKNLNLASSHELLFLLDSGYFLHVEFLQKYCDGAACITILQSHTPHTPHTPFARHSLSYGLPVL